MLKINPRKISVILLIPILLSCQVKKNKPTTSLCPSISSPCLTGKVLIQLSTNKGKIKIELNGGDAPVTAGNFLDLVNKGVYNKTVFHRVIKKPSPFVVIGGDPLSKEESTPKINYGKGNFIDPQTGKVRFIPLEIKLEKERRPRYSQLIKNPNKTSQIIMTHQKGSIAMARGQKKDSASSQFYISLKALPELDGRYAVFGKVIKGMHILDSINEGDLIISADML